jgi:hypothetical protein
MNRWECVQAFTGLAEQGLGTSRVVRPTALAEGEVK